MSSEFIKFLSETNEKFENFLLILDYWLIIILESKLDIGEPIVFSHNWYFMFYIVEKFK